MADIGLSKCTCRMEIGEKEGGEESNGKLSNMVTHTTVTNSEGCSIYHERFLPLFTEKVSGIDVRSYQRG